MRVVDSDSSRAAAVDMPESKRKDSAQPRAGGYVFISPCRDEAQFARDTGSLATVYGWMKSALTCQPRYGDERFREFLHRYQSRVLRVGKKRALEEIYNRPSEFKG